MDQAELRANDLRLDWYIQPRLEIQRPQKQAQAIDGAFLQWRLRPVPGKRKSQLPRVLRRWYQHEARHLVISDDPGQGKTCLSLRLEHLLCRSASSSRIFGDSMPRMVLHWMSRVPQISIPNPQLDDLLMADPSLIASFPDSSNRLKAIQYAKDNDRIIIVLDAFDELPGEQKERIRALFFESCKKIRWIVTGRDWAIIRAIASGGADSLFRPKDFFRIRIKPFGRALQDRYMARALQGVPWRESLEGDAREWDALLGLPATLREIVRAFAVSKPSAGKSSAKRSVKFSSPSDLFCFCFSKMLLNELGKDENRQAIAEQGLDLRPAKAARFIERAVGAVALEMALRGHWREVIRETTIDLDQEIDAIWSAAFIRFSKGVSSEPGADYGKIWKWARRFLEHYQFHGGAAQADLNAQSLVFRNVRVHELHVARYLTDFATPIDLRGDPQSSFKAVIDFLGDDDWENAWRLAIRMPIRTQSTPHGVELEQYQRAIEVLFERPIHEDQRRPTELMWDCDRWIKSQQERVSSLRGLDEGLRVHLRSQFLRILQGEEGESKQRIAEDLIDEKNFVLLADPECKHDAWDTGKYVRQVEDDESEGGYKDHGAVRLTRYQLCKYAISNEQFQLFDGNFNRKDEDDGKRFGGANQPAVFVSWFDGYWFSEFVVMKGASWQVVLPTEAQWEYGARAGSRGLYFRGLGGVEVTEDELKEYAHEDQYGLSGNTLAVRGHGKLPNAWGLEMMAGNVWEWCSDWYDDYPAGDVTDPVGPEEGSTRVNRGGSWSNDAANCRSADRDWNAPSNRSYFGFRVALSSIGNPQVAGGGQ